MLKRRSFIFITLIALILILFTITGYLGKYGFAWDVISNFRVQYLILLLMCLTLLFLAKKKLLSIIVVLFIIINLYEIIPLYFTNPASEDFDTKVKILLFNVCVTNNNYEKVADYIMECKPDILALMEKDEKWEEALSNVLNGFEYSITYPIREVHGTALYSHIKLWDPGIKIIGNSSRPSIVTELRFSGNEYTLLFTHAIAPKTPRRFHLRNKHLGNLAEYIKQMPDELIFIGDLNTTSWSYYFRQFQAKTDLEDSRRGFGVQPTWPTWFPPLMIPVDHCLVSPGIKVLDRKTGPYLGSDHKPVIIELGL
ncbi:endonuclease/exonuclease/phosphatase family protein [bacterium]|nr:endonuclease/exonuclease/phosphatase family protein [bacterium]